MESMHRKRNVTVLKINPWIKKILFQFISLYKTDTESFIFISYDFLIMMRTQNFTESFG